MTKEQPRKIVQIIPTGNPDFFLALDAVGQIWIGEINWTQLEMFAGWTKLVA